MLPWWLSGKESTCQCRRLGFDPNYGRSPGEGNGNPVQYSCLGNPWTEESGGLQCLPNSCETLNFGSLNPHASLQNGSCPAQLGEELELIYSSLYTVVGFLSIKENLSFNQITSMLLYCLKVIKILKWAEKVRNTFLVQMTNLQSSSKSSFCLLLPKKNLRERSAMTQLSIKSHEQRGQSATELNHPIVTKERVLYRTVGSTPKNYK